MDLPKIVAISDEEPELKMGEGTETACPSLAIQACVSKDVLSEHP